MMRNYKNKILTVKGLSKFFGERCPECIDKTGPEYNTNQCPVCSTIVACADISFDVYEGEILGIVGESGSGKTTISRSLYFEEEASSGEMYLNNYDPALNIFELSLQKKRTLRNKMLGMVYQNPHQGLRLNFTAGGNIAEKILSGGHYHVGKIREKASYLLDRSEISVKRMDDFPKNFSGGMQQRVQIAKAIANDPEIVFMDEVSSGLDVSVQARVLDLIKQLQRDLNMTMLVVSHDLGVIRLLTDRTIVVKNGRIVEKGLTDQILEDPQHEYTQLLVNSLL
ncbi:putative phosphonate transport system ATP-binding protein [Halanaerobium congolense]|jgi:putative phosphonate transport system ATP-binding protein|uniref:Putative phosphonate transport system ATP-binding protein n=2 Tax=Halanaerobium congolense TaxID=54121 RepID=A0A318E3D9_9FIRM|nr:putative phosphonate transport system ATP-binding protein [Halanaerobium congolense]